MSLANAYAAVIAEAEEKGEGAEFVKKLIALMKSRGHLSLLPQVVRILERSAISSKTPVVVLAKESDHRKFSKEIREALAKLGTTEEARTIVDPRSVGGYSVRASSKIIDNSFRSALISLYQNTVRS